MESTPRQLISTSAKPIIWFIYSATIYPNFHNRLIVAGSCSAPPARGLYGVTAGLAVGVGIVISSW